jgi:predicted O-methyltransferase YrrM
MEHYTISDFFTRINYNWKDHREYINNINRLTKTKRNTRSNTNIEHPYMEQAYLLHALVEYYNCTNFFEIGTGRGTGSYSVSLLPSVEKIVTLDIIPMNRKMDTYVNFELVNVSLRDIYNMIPYSEKKKIEFITSTSFDFDVKNNINKFDVAFIDGDHDNIDTIINDFEVSNQITKDDGVIIFDDYLNIEGSTRAIDKIISNHPEYSYYRVSFYGKLFDHGPVEDSNQNVVILEKKPKFTALNQKNQGLYHKFLM